MPELPEVETIKKTLNQLVINKTITEVNVYWPNIIKKPNDVEEFKHKLIGQTIKRVHRKGKFLLFELNDYMLVSHLRMEGKYSIHSVVEPLKKHTHVVFSFSNNEQLRYNDVRKFGTMHLIPKGEENLKKPLNQLGPDPFEEQFTCRYLCNQLGKTSRVIKVALLDQTIVSGLGNIYVDEVLFRARIHPLKKSNELSESEINAIRKHAIDTLNEAVTKGGTTIRSYVNGQGEMGMFQQELFVYGQESHPCKQCGQTIEKLKVGGRGTHICSNCQKYANN